MILPRHPEHAILTVNAICIDTFCFHDHLRSFHLLLILHSSEFCFIIIHIIPHWIMCTRLESILHHLDNSIPLLSILRHLRLVFSDLGFLCSLAQSTRLGNSLLQTETISFWFVLTITFDSLMRKQAVMLHRNVNNKREKKGKKGRKNEKKRKIGKKEENKKQGVKKGRGKGRGGKGEKRREKKGKKGWREKGETRRERREGGKEREGKGEKNGGKRRKEKKEGKRMKEKKRKKSEEMQEWMQGHHADLQSAVSGGHLEEVARVSQFITTAAQE